MDYEIEMADIAASQWGLITARQALEVGATSNVLTRLADKGALERVTHGVYRISGAPPSSLDDLRADWLALDPGTHASDRRWGGLELGEPLAIVSHRSAARLHDLGDIDADDHEFTLAVRKQTRRTGVKIHRLPIAEDDWTLVDGLPVTTPLRTIDDLASAHIDGGHLASIVRDAIATGGADDEDVIRVLRRHARFYGAPMGDGNELLKFFLQEAGVPKAATSLAAHASDADLLLPLFTQADGSTTPETKAVMARYVAEHLGTDLRASLDRWLSHVLGGLSHEAIKAVLSNAALSNTLPDISEAVLKGQREMIAPVMETALLNRADINRIARSLEKMTEAGEGLHPAQFTATLRAAQPNTDEQTQEKMHSATKAIAAGQDPGDSATAIDGDTEVER